jgi:hypothetical protein
VLVERHQLGDQDVVQVHDVDVHRHHAEPLPAGEHLVIDQHPRRFEDQVDQDLAVPGLQQPLLGRGLGPHPRLGENILRALGVLALEHQVDVVARWWPAARPAAEPAAQQVGDARALECRDRPLEAVGQLFGDLALA